MSSNLSPFRIEVYNAQGDRIGGGPIATALSVNNTKRLDTIGNLEFTLPASDNWGEIIVTGTQFDVYDEIDGYLGRFLFKSKSIQDQSGRAILRVECYDKLKELTFETVGFFRDYNFEPVSNVLSEIIALVSGWAVETSVTNNTTIDFQGESVYRALDVLRDRFGYHFRLKNDGSQTLEFGSFGTLLDDIHFNQFNGQIQSDWLRNPNNALVSGITIVEESDEIFNKIIPLGFGQGVSQLTIEEATLGNYTVQSELNDDGSLRYYIADSASIASYGQRTRILQFPNIRPISNSNQNIINAANALKLTAEAYLAKHLVPRKEYQVDVKHLRQPVTVGDKIRIKYNQEWNGVNYISLDDEFYVMDISYNRSSNGNRTYSLNIANVDDRRTSDQDVIINVVRDLKDIGVHIPATLAYSESGPYVLRGRGDASPASQISPEFIIRYGSEVIYLNRCLIIFTTSPLTSDISAIAAQSGGSSSPTSSSGGSSTETSTATGLSTGLMIPLGGDHRHDIVPHDHDLSIPAHQHTVTISGHTHTLDITYDVFEDTDYLQNISILLNGIDITSNLIADNGLTGSYLAPTNISYSYEFDITDYILNTTGGFRQNHTLQFVSLAGKGNITWQADSLVTIQAIRSF